MPRYILLLPIFLSPFLALTAFGGLSLRTQANVMVELTLTAARTYADPFNQVELDAVFVDPTGHELRVPAFWDGGRTWKARYASPLVGAHHFHTECSQADDGGLNGVSGTVQIVAYTGENPLYRHGPLRVAASRRSLEHLDGQPFFWLGDTWWMGLCHRLHWPEEFQQLTADRKAKGFNVIQIVAGLYPDMFPFDPRGANEAGFPWETNYARIRPQYFDEADKRLGYLVEQGFTPCIVGSWGYFMPWMGVEKMKAHWRNLIARYGAWPVVWCAAGEVGMPWYLDKGSPEKQRQQVHDWTQVLRYIRATDPWHHLLTLHPSDTSRHGTEDPALLDFDMLQTGHGRQEAAIAAVHAVRQSYAASPVMPVIDGEASYEMLNDSMPTEWTRRMFWVSLMNGAPGHTYGANGIWQCNRPGQPHGNSPHGGNWGVFPWNEAMRLPGSQQVGFGKKLLQQFAWQDFRPHPDWTAFEPSLLAKASWIWYPEGNPAVDAPAAARFFQRTFVLPAGRAVARARLRLSVDDQFAAQLNGTKLGGSDDWHVPREFDNIAGALQAGTNVLLVSATNKPASGANPAGLIAALEIQFADGANLKIVSDHTWRCAKSDTAEAWTNAIVAARFGEGPWGDMDGGNDDANGPQSAGIPGVVRVSYVPRAEVVEERHLGWRATYRARWFDPVTGVTTPLGDIRCDENGVWRCAPPAGLDHDWVLILELKKEKDSATDHHSTVSNAQLDWHFDWSEGPLRSVWFENKMSGHRFVLTDTRELGLVFSAAADRVAEPVTRAEDFEVRGVRWLDPQHAVFDLRSHSVPIDVALHFQLDGAARRKWAEVTNRSDHDLLLLDVNLDDFTTEAGTSGGGNGKPLFIGDEAFAAIEHPAGVNDGAGGRVQLSHYPGRRLAPGEGYRTHTAVVSVAEKGGAREHFVSWLQAASVRPKRFLSVYTPFGINNQWGACPALDDVETLDVLSLLQKFQKSGVSFDYFTLDTGWVDPASDLTRFRPTCYPQGPGEIVKQVGSMGMKFGLWFGTSWGTESCWDYAAAFANGFAPQLPFRDGYPLLDTSDVNFCFASEPYFSIFKNAVLYHVRNNHVRFLKFDGGNYYCDSADHGHLPGKYSVAAMFDNLIDVAQSVHDAAPDTFILWYWGAGSPFWALYGDMVFESGLEMEGSGTSRFPALYYRDSVTLAQDQNAQFASTIPPAVKDSLGVWLADTRWGNFMGKERWRPALVMDLGRGSLLFPNLWGDLYQLSDQDVDFLARVSALAKKNESLFLHRRNILGDPARNEVYGYAYGRKAHGFIFLNNDYFAARRVELPLDKNIGLEAAPGTALRVVSLFPDQSRLRRRDGLPFKLGDTLDFWLRPFEVLLLEVTAGTRDGALPLRSISDGDAQGLGAALTLQTAAPDKRTEVRFADASSFERKDLKPRTYAYETTLPPLESDHYVLAVAIQLRRGEADWRYAPTVCQIVQATARMGGEDVQLVPVPDSRQFGNTQSFGCSWVVYKVRLSRQWARQPLQLAVHAFLPEGVEARTEAWVLKQWWQEDARPTPDGYYNDAPQ
jgi:hypothetical protein